MRVRPLVEFFRALLGRRRLDAELETELRFHIDRETEARVHEGMTPSQARRTALRDFGGVTRYKEELRETRGVRPIDDLAQDVRYALRTFARSPSFAAIAIATLGVGIGASTAVFSAVDGVLLKPLPYRDADRLVTLWQSNRRTGADRQFTSPASFLDWQARSRSFTGIAAAEPYGVAYRAPDGNQSIKNWLVSDGFFDILGTRPVLGRTFRSEEHAAGRDRVLVLSYGMWQRYFGADASVIGRTVTIDEAPATIIGVMPPEFAAPPGKEMWMPKVFTPDDLESRGRMYYRVYGRLRPGVTLEAAAAEMHAIGLALGREYPRTNADLDATVVPLAEEIVGAVRPTLLVLLGSVGLVLLIACANVASLLLARASRRERELAVRVALGAGRTRVVRQLLTESVVLALTGGAIGVALGWAGVRAIRLLSPPDLPRLNEMHLDLRAVAFAIAASLLTAILFGLVPAVRASVPDVHDTLRDGTRSTSGRARHRLRGALVVVEVALSLVLLIGSGLLVRSLISLLEVDRGYRTSGVLSVNLYIWDHFPRDDQQTAFVDDAIARIGALRGVRNVGVASALPLAERLGREETVFHVDGAPPTPPGQRPTVHTTVATGSYFSALGIPLRRGRLFEPRDRVDAPLVMLVNESFARQHWPNEDPVGKRVTTAFSGPVASREVVGVVSDVRRIGLDAAPVPAIYLPYSQSPTGSITIAVETSGSAGALLPDVRRTLLEINPNLSIYSSATMESLVDASLRPRRFMLNLLSAFSTIALALAAIGIYGVISQTTGERTREIGVRMALGAQRGEVLRMVLRRGVALAAIGVVLGTAGAFATTGLLRRMLFGVTAADPLTFGGVIVLVLVVAGLASAIPAYRAARIPPTEALRQ